MKAGKSLKVLAFIALLLSLVGQPALAAEFRVSSDSACTLADAIRAANKNAASGGCDAGGEIDVIRVTGDITLTSQLPTIRTNMTIISDDPSVKRTISGDFNWRIFNIDNGPHVTIRSLQLINGRNSGQRGGAIRIVNGKVALIDLRMENNWAEKRRWRAARRQPRMGDLQHVRLRRQPKHGRRRHLGRRQQRHHPGRQRGLQQYGPARRRYVHPVRKRRPLPNFLLEQPRCRRRGYVLH